MRLIGYTRVSPIEQEYNTSLPDQERKIKAYCQAFDYELVAVVREVTAGTKKDVGTRPEFNKALDMLRQDEADGIVALKLDRLVRNAKDVLLLVDDVLKPLNKNLILLDVEVDTSTPTQKMILTMMAAVAQLEAGMNRERIQGEKRAKLEKDAYAYGSPTFAQKTVNGEIVPDQDELDAIEAIRRQHQSGKSFQAIAAWMNLNGYKTERGSQWQANSVKRVVDRFN
ncbi:site-specific recombinase for integration and excision [Calothrix sp. NIES-2100]|uniref:recombinase family protein n=1 Tax=Calothrix sp. NIES-2100 TaxID=1954172 RepID=UPI000B5DE8DD|nr:site-specific recombinase for integration and excision [Calothrix sp. NIES-2100]